MNVNPISLIFIAFTTPSARCSAPGISCLTIGLGVVLVISLFIAERPWWRR
jgi:hypothetical protein